MALQVKRLKLGGCGSGVRVMEYPQLCFWALNLGHSLESSEEFLLKKNTAPF